MSKLYKRAIQYLKWLIHKRRLHRKLKEMDDWWYFMGGNCFGLFPPSFYYTHTDEEVKRMTEETLAELHAIIEKFEAENSLKVTE